MKGDSYLIIIGIEYHVKVPDEHEPQYHIFGLRDAEAKPTEVCLSRVPVHDIGL